MKTIILLIFITINIYASGESTQYQWNAFIQRAVDVSFTLRQDDARLALEKGKVDRSTLWENPEVNIAFDDELKDSLDYRYFEFSQRLPAWGENESKQKGARFKYEQAEHSKALTALQVQYRAASLFQKLYASKSRLTTLDEQLVQIEALREKSISREDAGEISGMERSRIDIMRQQLLMRSKSLHNDHHEMIFEAQALLHVDEEITISGDIDRAQEVNVEMMQSSLEQSPEYRVYEAQVQATKQGLALARSKRYALPEVYVYTGREFDVNTQIKDIYGVGLRISVPLWNQQSSQIEIEKAKIQKESIKAQEVLYTIERKASSLYKLYQDASSHSVKYKQELLDTAKKYYETSAFSFGLGEKSLLGLLDAQTLYFQSQLEYQDLVSRSDYYWLRSCEAASIDLLKDNQ